jgi:hypothetical protein
MCCPRASTGSESGAPWPGASSNARSIIPISATRLREDPRRHRAFLSEPVRRSLLRRVAVIGGESTGKTTLAAALAAKLGTCWVPEHGRELWQRRNGKLCFDDMLPVGREQVTPEERALSDGDSWLICDTTPLVTAFYSDALYGRVGLELAGLSKRRDDHVPHSVLDGPVMVRLEQALGRLGRLEPVVGTNPHGVCADAGAPRGARPSQECSRRPRPSACGSGRAGPA